MIQATYQDKDYILNILCNRFKDNPTAKAFSRKKGNEHHVMPMLTYAFYYSMKRGGIYLSNDRTCVAFFNHSKKAKFTFAETFYLLKFLLFGVCLRKLWIMNAHLHKIKETKPSNSHYYHFWFLAANENSSVHSTMEFLNELFDLAKEKNLAIYAETTIPKNEAVYARRFGFQTFETIRNDKLNISVSLMKRLP